MRIKPSKIEYVTHALNFATGECEHRCVYCYNKRWKWAKGPLYVDTDLKQLERQLRKFEPEGDILISSSHDPLGSAMLRLVFKDIMERITLYPDIAEKIRILTKGWASSTILRVFSNLPFSEKIKFGVTISTLNEQVAKFTELGATTIGYRLQLLRWAHSVGFKTWISAEPMLHGASLQKIIMLVPFVSEIWVGKMNHHTSHYAMPDYEIMQQIKNLNTGEWTTVYLKKELR